MRIDVRHAFRPKQNSVRCSQVMDCFGIGFERGAHVIADGLELPVRPRDVVLFTGASGSGKSSLMRAVVEGLRTAGVDGEVDTAAPLIVDVNLLELGERTLIDSFAAPVDETMHLLSSCGLGEAQLMLRTPAELSDGQRYRFRLALGLAAQPAWLVADEFTATLDRTLAKVVAYNVRRLCDRTGTGFLLATTHEDVAADLDPDVHVRCRTDGEIVVQRRDATAVGECDVAVCKKKECCRSATSCGSARRPSPTGRTEQVSIPFTEDIDDLPVIFRRRQTRGDACDWTTDDTGTAANEPALAPATLKRMLKELLGDGSIHKSPVARMGHERVGYSLSGRRVADELAGSANASMGASDEWTSSSTLDRGCGHQYRDTVSVSTAWK